MNFSDRDTIAAVSTPSGEGGISIVRMSGDESIAIAASIFSPAVGGDPSFNKSHTMHYGHIKTPHTGELVDEVLVSVMKAPNTYTREDIVEINCHGGKISPKKVLELCIDQGARVALPGEFTKRAFLNGRLNLSQAEAVLDIITSETDKACRIALKQMEGAFSSEIKEMRETVIDIISRIELSIDFSDEDVSFSPVDEISREVKSVHAGIKGLLDTCEKGQILREGASVVICGRPNVGKSSLMNALLRHDRVIVTSIAGTTRDVVEEAINIKGIKVHVSDTAGIIDTTDRVELEGIKRSKKKLEAADVVIFMLDHSRALTERDSDIFNAIKDKKVIIAANKEDLPAKFDINDAVRIFGGKDIIKVSMAKKEGLEEIEDAIADSLLDGGTIMPEDIVVTNARHTEALKKAFTAIQRSINLTGSEYNGELLSSDMKEAEYQLGLIIGEEIDDAVLDRIFSRFCIGK